MTDSWKQRAFPTLPPTEAEAVVAGLDEIAWHQLRDLMDAPDPDGLRGGLALAYSGIIADLLAENSRQLGPHRRRWLVWHLSGGDIERRGTGLTVTRWLNENDGGAVFFGFPTGVEGKKRRSAIVKELLAEMRAAVREGGRPYTLNRVEEIRLETWMSFDDLDKV